MKKSLIWQIIAAFILAVLTGVIFGEKNKYCRTTWGLVFTFN